MNASTRASAPSPCVLSVPETSRCPSHSMPSIADSALNTPAA